MSTCVKSGEHDERRWNGSRQRVDHEEQLVERLREREHRHRRRELRPPHGGQDPADQPRGEEVSVVG
jgi:hypothetical protein